MGIKFTCPACGRALNVKSELAGKRGRCPKCQAKIAIPLHDAPGSEAAEGGAQNEPESSFLPETKTPAAVPSPAIAASAPAPGVAPGGKFVSVEEQTTSLPAPQTAAGGVPDPIGEAPSLQWYAVPPGAASQYGPASGEEFRVWLQEGRITADALVWRQDWADWKRAGVVFPQLEAQAAAGAAVAVPALGAPVAAPAAMPLPTAVAAMPMMGGSPPVAQPAFPMTGVALDPFAMAAPSAPLASGSFPITGAEPATTRGTSTRGRAYRSRSNTGPVVAIVVLLLAMIPLSFFVWKVVSEQFGAAPPAPAAETATGSKQPEE